MWPVWPLMGDNFLSAAFVNILHIPFPDIQICPPRSISMCQYFKETYAWNLRKRWKSSSKQEARLPLILNPYQLAPKPPRNRIQLFLWKLISILTIYMFICPIHQEKKKSLNFEIKQTFVKNPGCIWVVLTNWMVLGNTSLSISKIFIYLFVR